MLISWTLCQLDQAKIYEVTNVLLKYLNMKRIKYQIRQFFFFNLSWRPFFELIVRVTDITVETTLWNKRFFYRKLVYIFSTRPAVKSKFP